jgi:acetyl-CoA acetyltransferase
LRGHVCVAGVGESGYHKRGQADRPEFLLAVDAITAACVDAGMDVRDVDGFASYANDRNEPTRLAAALGCHELRFANMQWGGGGGGGSGAVANAAAAIHAGLADCIVVFRALAQGQFGRFGAGSTAATVSGGGAMSAPYGLMSAAQQFAMRMTRFMYEHDISPSTQKAVALASYHHAQQNPRAVMHGRPLTSETYDESRWIVEPWRLYDCCMENDGAAAIVLVSSERAGDLPHRPCHVLGAAIGGGFRDGASAQNAPLYASSCFTDVAPRLYEMAGVSPQDVEVVQAYENFTGGVVMALVEHGLCSYDDANEVLQFDNLIAPGGRLPLNTSGGNLAECYVHGFELIVEAVRQVRGDSNNQVHSRRDATHPADVSLVISGPMVVPATDVLFGSDAVLA